ncbi:MAG: hypothetical protein SPI77_03910 [Corynebacterium sp.]|nr:hypothetical protein [Corynebacterium sp.]
MVTGTEVEICVVSVTVVVVGSILTDGSNDAVTVEVVPRSNFVDGTHVVSVTGNTDDEEKVCQPLTHLLLELPLALLSQCLPYVDVVVQDVDIRVDTTGREVATERVVSTGRVLTTVFVVDTGISVFTTRCIGVGMRVGLTVVDVSVIDPSDNVDNSGKMAVS